jgi:hypothetical protein
VTAYPPLGRRAAVLALAASAVLAAASLLPAPAAAHGYKLGAISIGHVWAPPPLPGVDGVPVYGPILNGGAQAVRLVGVSTPVANAARFRIAKDGAVSWPDAVEFRPGRPLAMAAWRRHIWLSGLTRPLNAGDSFELTLDFGPQGSKTVTVVVETAPGH